MKADSQHQLCSGSSNKDTRTFLNNIVFEKISRLLWSLYNAIIFDLLDFSLSMYAKLNMYELSVSESENETITLKIWRFFSIKTFQKVIALTT